MKRKSNHIGVGCHTWQSQIERLLGLPDDDPERIVWVNHAVECPECGLALAQEQEFKQLMVEIPDPGRAVIADTVMRRIRTGNRDVLTVKPRDLAWGLAGSLVGVILGLWIAGASPDQIQISSTDLYASEFAELQDDIDLFTWDLADETGDLQ